MHYKRVIPCLDVDRGRVVKGVGSWICATPGTRSSWRPAMTLRAPTSSCSSTSPPPPTSGRPWSSSPGDRRRGVHPVHDRGRDPLRRQTRRPCSMPAPTRFGELGGARAARADRRAGRHIRGAVRGPGDRRQGAAGRGLGGLRGRRAERHRPGCGGWAGEAPSAGRGRSCC